MAIDGNIFVIQSYPAGIEPGVEGTLSKQEEDALLMDSTGDLPDWIANFIRRVILLLENLPDEDSSGNADGATEGKAYFTNLYMTSALTSTFQCKSSTPSRVLAVRFVFTFQIIFTTWFST